MFLPPGYHINLTQPNVNDLDTELADLPPYIFPRLSPNADGSIEVPLMSDLMLHDMGDALADVEDQEVDVNGVFVPRRYYLTRPLWGVADSGPWLHDGRSFDLHSAILWHKSEGSEANAVITVFESLSAADQQALLTFLGSHRLGIEQQEPQILYQGDSGPRLMGIRTIERSNGRITIRFDGALHTSESPIGPYTPVPDSSSPYTFVPERGKSFFIAR